MSDLIRREDAIKAIDELPNAYNGWSDAYDKAYIIGTLEEVPSADLNAEFAEWAKLWFKKELEADRSQGEWIPCSERLPKDIRPVLVTWKNTDPASYYQYIVGKHFIGTAHYHRGKWYWYSSVTEDLLAEYGKCETEEFDEAIEAVAWMPLPKPYREREDE